jgi:Rieske Fe-S protein
MLKCAIINVGPLQAILSPCHRRYVFKKIASTCSRVPAFQKKNRSYLFSQGQMLTIKWRGKPVFIKHRCRALPACGHCIPSPVAGLKPRSRPLARYTAQFSQPNRGFVHEINLALARSPLRLCATLKTTKFAPRYLERFIPSNLVLCFSWLPCVPTFHSNPAHRHAQDTHPHILICLGVCTHLG